MPRPDFTNEERYLIESIKSRDSASVLNSNAWSYVICSALIAGSAAYYGDIAMMTIAFVIICGYRFYEWKQQQKWDPIWRSIIEKFESATIEVDEKPYDSTILPG